jgi:SAM-dependent methyltransferase
MLTLEEWHNRFMQQARWTESVRRFLFQMADLAHARNVLEVGCGSGAILTDLRTQTKARIFGIDLKREFLRRVSDYKKDFLLACADGFHLPFQDQSFSITCCHFLLLWVKDPVQVISEMKRVTHKGGFVLALAEPDYGSRIDHPISLMALGQLQGQSLQRQGADPNTGRKIKGFFHQAGLVNVQMGIIGGQWDESFNPDELESEWKVLEADLKELVPEKELARLKQIDFAAWHRGDRVLYVPTFYAWGKV